MIQKMNAGIPTRLEEVADILEAQQANPYRVQAYRRAAMTVRNCDRLMDEIVREEDIEGLQKPPGIGESLSRAIHQLVTSGRLPMLERLRGVSYPVEVLTSDSKIKIIAVSGLTGNGRMLKAAQAGVKSFLRNHTRQTDC